MPEGPEVRKFADALDAVLSGRAITALEGRTRETDRGSGRAHPHCLLLREMPEVDVNGFRK